MRRKKLNIVYGAQGGKNLKIKLEKIKEENMEDKNVIRSDEKYN